MFKYFNNLATLNQMLVSASGRTVARREVRHCTTIPCLKCRPASSDVLPGIGNVSRVCLSSRSEDWFSHNCRGDIETGNGHVSLIEYASVEMHCHVGETFSNFMIM